MASELFKIILSYVAFDAFNQTLKAKLLMLITYISIDPSIREPQKYYMEDSRAADQSLSGDRAPSRHTQGAPSHRPYHPRNAIMDSPTDPTLCTPQPSQLSSLPLSAF